MNKKAVACIGFNGQNFWSVMLISLCQYRSGRITLEWTYTRNVFRSTRSLHHANRIFICVDRFVRASFNLQFRNVYRMSTDLYFNNNSQSGRNIDKTQSPYYPRIVSYEPCCVRKGFQKGPKLILGA